MSNNANIRNTSRYQYLDISDCRIEGKINQTATFHQRIWNLTPEVWGILKILWKRGEIAPEEQFLLFSTIFCYLLLDFHVKTGTRLSLQDKRLFEIGRVKIKGQDKENPLYKFFSHYSMKTYVVGTHKKCDAEVLLMSTHNLFFHRKTRNCELLLMKTHNICFLLLMKTHNICFLLLMKTHNICFLLLMKTHNICFLLLMKTHNICFHKEGRKQFICNHVNK